MMMTFKEIGLRLAFQIFFMILIDIVFSKRENKIKEAFSLNRLTLFTCLAGGNVVYINRGIPIIAMLPFIVVFILFFTIVISPKLKKIDWYQPEQIDQE